MTACARFEAGFTHLGCGCVDFDWLVVSVLIMVCATECDALGMESERMESVYAVA